MFRLQPSSHLPPEVAKEGNELLQASLAPTVKWSQCLELLKNFASPTDWHLAWKACFRDWHLSCQGPAPMWLPGENEQHCCNLGIWMRELGLKNFKEFHQWTIADRARFWGAAIQKLSIRFHRQPETILDPKSDLENPDWLSGAELNIAESCFQAPDSDVALVYGRPQKDLQHWTYRELKARMFAVAAAIHASGFRPGDRLAVVLPMTAESVAIYLGIIAAGCVVVSIADSFASREIRNRLTIAKAQAVFTYDLITRAGKEISLYSKVKEATELPIVVLSEQESVQIALRTLDLPYSRFLERGNSTPLPNFHYSDSASIINILFSSGTTGDPKAIPWTQTTPIKCAIDGYCHQDLRPGQVACWPTNLGWMMGPFLIFATLINQGTIALYEDAPVGPAFGKFVQDARVNMLGVIPTLVKSWRATREMEPYDWSKINVFSSTGESSQADDMFYLSALAGMRPVIEYCGGTEIGGGYISSTVLEPNYPSLFTTPAVGLDFVILDDQGQRSDEGELFIIPPSIGLSTRLLNRDHHQTYYANTPQSQQYPVLRRHGDHFRKVSANSFAAGGRVDDTMNLGGIKISSTELERVMNEVEGVRETAAVALARKGGPEELYVFAVCLEAKSPQRLLEEFNHKLKIELNPLFRVKDVRVVEQLPRTASNKVMRRELRDLLLSQT